MIPPSRIRITMKLRFEAKNCNEDFLQKIEAEGSRLARFPKIVSRGVPFVLLSGSPLTLRDSRRISLSHLQKSCTKAQNFCSELPDLIFERIVSHALRVWEVYQQLFFQENHLQAN